MLLSQFLFPRRVPNLAAYRFTPLAMDPTTYGRPAWSPDGKSIAYSEAVDGVHQIFVRSLEAPTALQVTRLRPGAREPFWSADSRRIFFISNLRPGGRVVSRGRRR